MAARTIPFSRPAKTAAEFPNLLYGTSISTVTISVWPNPVTGKEVL